MRPGSGLPYTVLCRSDFRRPGRSTGAGRRWTAQPFRRKGEAETGLNPTDRGKSDTKRHLVTDARATPLALTLSGANRHDSAMPTLTLDAIPPIRTGHRRRPRRRPDKLHADKAYDRRRCRRECRARGVTRASPAAGSRAKPASGGTAG